MAIPFHPYPLPPEDNEPHPVAQVADRFQRMVGMLGQYQLQQQQTELQKETLRQQQINNYLQRRAEYVDPAQYDRDMAAAGMRIPGFNPQDTAAPAQGAVQGPAMPPPAVPMPGASNVAGIAGLAQAPAAPAPAPAPGIAAPTGPRSIMDWTPEAMQEKIRTAKTYKQKSAAIEEANAAISQRKGMNEIEQNAPSSPEQVRAVLSPFGQAGAAAAEKLIMASPDGKISKAEVNTVATGLSRITQVGSANTKPPPGYRFNREGNLEAIPGGPADAKLDEKTAKEQAMRDSSVRQAKTVVGAVDRALLKVNAWTAGLGSRFAAVPGTPAKDLEAELRTIKANLSFETLAEMRRNSPSGGALGSVANRELDLLESTVSSLDQAQSPEELIKALMRIRKHAGGWQETLNQAGGGGASAGGAPTENPPRAAAAGETGGTIDPTVGPQGKTIKQGNNTYTWNPTTRRYE